MNKPAISLRAAPPQSAPNVPVMSNAMSAPTIAGAHPDLARELASRPGQLAQHVETPQPRSGDLTGVIFARLTEHDREFAELREQIAELRAAAVQGGPDGQD